MPENHVCNRHFYETYSDQSDYFIGKTKSVFVSTMQGWSAVPAPAYFEIYFRPNWASRLSEVMKRKEG